jgi:hypothetical protein
MMAVIFIVVGLYQMRPGHDPTVGLFFLVFGLFVAFNLLTEKRD